MHIISYAGIAWYLKVEGASSFTRDWNAAKWLLFKDVLSCWLAWWILGSQLVSAHSQILFFFWPIYPQHSRWYAAISVPDAMFRNYILIWRLQVHEVHDHDVHTNWCPTLDPQVPASLLGVWSGGVCCLLPRWTLRRRAGTARSGHCQCHGGESGARTGHCPWK